MVTSQSIFTDFAGGYGLDLGYGLDGDSFYMSGSFSATDMYYGTGAYTPPQRQERAGVGWPPYGNPSACQ